MPARSVLMVYDRFPPFNVSGSARVFHFARHLPEHGYQPVVLCSTPAPEHPQDEGPLGSLPPSTHILRATPWLTPPKDRLARWLNRRRRSRPSWQAPRIQSQASSKRVFSHGSLAWRMTGLPMWILEWHLDWAPAAILKALGDPFARAVDLVWVSAPDVRNLFVGAALSRLLRKPLVVDLRDPWTYGSLWKPRGNLVARSERLRARRILSHAARVVVTSPLTQREMEQRFPEARFVTITNGFSVDPDLVPARDIASDRCLFRYVGLLNERRTPGPLLAGLAIACRDPKLRASVHFEFVGPTDNHERQIKDYGLEDVVSLRGSVPHRHSLELMRGSDVNVVLQTIRDGQDVIAGKTFEYLAAGKPILAVVSETGGDAWLLRQVGCRHIASYEDPERIAAAIRGAVADHAAGRCGHSLDKIAQFERGALTSKLACVFNEVLSEH